MLVGGSCGCFMGSFWPGFNPFGAVGGGGGGLVRSVWSRELGVRASPSGAYPAGRLQWHFTCGFDFTHGL